MRAAWLLSGLVAVAAVAVLPAGCGAPFENGSGAGGGSTSASSTSTHGASATTGDGVTASASGGTTTSSSSSTSSSSATGGMVCMSAKDCGQSDFCTSYSCAGGACMSQMKPKGTQLPSQIYGDCHVDICSMIGKPVTGTLDSDVYDDGNPCTDNLCTLGVPSNPPKLKNSSCDGGMICDGKGHCVQCTDDNQCTSDPKKKCNPNGVCVTDACDNGQLDPGETDIDCGGLECPACADTQTCSVDGDCQGKHCVLMLNNITSSCVSTCSDQTKNQNETDTDCGGKCAKKCDTGQHCAKPGDCKSQVCKVGICQPPACNDGVQNGQETGIDCGGGCMACPP